LQFKRNLLVEASPLAQGIGAAWLGIGALAIIGQRARRRPAARRLPSAD